MGRLSSKKAERPMPPPPQKTMQVSGIDSQPTVVAPPDHDAGWGYLYLASEIARGLGQLDGEYDRYASGKVIPNDVAVTDPATDIPARTKSLTVAVTHINDLLAPALMEKAFGPLGTAGDEATIRYMADGIVGVHRSCLQWGQELRIRSRQGGGNGRPFGSLVTIGGVRALEDAELFPLKYPEAGRLRD